MTKANGNVTEESPLLQAPQSEVTADGTVEAVEAVHDHDAANQSVGTARGVLIMLSLWLLIFLQASNMSGLTTTQSKIAADLDAFSEASWFTSTYLIAASSIAPLAGRLSQIFTPRACVFVASIIFAIGGLVTSQARTLSVFLLGRGISGVGAAGILTLSIILILELTGKKKRGLFIGLMNAGYTSGVALGAVIAGALLPLTGWRALFWAQTPLGLVAGLGVFFSIPKSFVTGPQGSDKLSLGTKLARIDYLGAVTLTSSIVLFLLGLSSAKVSWILIIISVVSLIVFILNEFLLASDPIIPVSVLKSRGILLSCLAQLGFMSSRWMVLFYTPVYGIAIRGWSPAKSGSMLIATNGGFALGGLLVGWIHIRRAGSFWSGCVLSFLLFSLTLLILSRISNTEVAAAWYVVATFFNGLVTGAALNYTLAHILHLSHPSTHFIVTSLLATFRGFAGSFGSAIGGGIFTRLLQSVLRAGFEEKGLLGEEDLIRRLLGSPALVQDLAGDERDVAVTAYVAAVKGLFAAGAGLALVMVLVQAGTGWKAPVEKECVVEQGEERERDE